MNTRAVREYALIEGEVQGATVVTARLSLKRRGNRPR